MSLYIKPGFPSESFATTINGSSAWFRIKNGNNYHHPPEKWRYFGYAHEYTRAKTATFSSAIPVHFANSDDTAVCTISLSIFTRPYTYITRYWDTNKRIVHTSDPKYAVDRFYTISIADLLKLHYHCEKSAQIAGNNNQKPDGPSADTVTHADQHAKQKMQEKTQKLIKRCLRTETLDKCENIVGVIRRGVIEKIEQLDCREATENDFFNSKLVLDDTIDDTTLRRDYSNGYKLSRAPASDEQIRERLCKRLLDVASNRDIVEAISRYHHFGETLYTRQEDQTRHFDEPVTMEQFLCYAPQDWSDLKDAKTAIFKTLNANERATLEKQEPLVVTSVFGFGERFEKFPAFLFRKLQFTVYSDNLARQVCTEAQYSRRMMRQVPKRWRNQKERAIREDWITNRWSDHLWCYSNTKGQQKRDAKALNAALAESADEIADEQRDRQLLKESVGDDELAFGYSLPAILDEVPVGDDAEFLTDQEARERCMEIDRDQALSLAEKVYRLNIIARSRMQPDDTTYRLILPGSAVDTSDAAPANFTFYQRTFFAPTCDTRLPNIVLLSFLCTDD